MSTILSLHTHMPLQIWYYDVTIDKYCCIEVNYLIKFWFKRYLYCEKRYVKIYYFISVAWIIFKWLSYIEINYIMQKYGCLMIIYLIKISNINLSYAWYFNLHNYYCYKILCDIYYTSCKKERKKWIKCKWTDEKSSIHYSKIGY